MPEVLLYTDGVGVFNEGGHIYRESVKVPGGLHIAPKYVQLKSLTPYQRAIAVRYAIMHYKPGNDIDELLEEGTKHIDIQQNDILVARSDTVVYKLCNYCFLGYVDHIHPAYIRWYDKDILGFDKAVECAIGAVRGRATPCTVNTLRQMLIRRLGTPGHPRLTEAEASRYNFVISVLNREIYIDLENQRVIVPILLNSHYSYKEQKKIAYGMVKELVQIARKGVQSDRTKYLINNGKAYKLVVSEVNTAEVWFQCKL